MTTASAKTTLIELLDELPSERIAEVLDFALFLKHRAVLDESKRAERFEATTEAIFERRHDAYMRLAEGPREE
jgi:hypothetical protein